LSFFFNFLLRLFYCNKLMLPPFVLLLFFHHLLPGWGTWMAGWRGGWMERTPNDINGGTALVRFIVNYNSYYSLRVRFSPLQWLRGQLLYIGCSDSFANWQHTGTHIDPKYIVCIASISTGFFFWPIPFL
jgi:hypothetical protein